MFMRVALCGRRAALLCAVLALSACYIPHPRFGADNFRHDEDTNGVPTYTASGSIGYEEKAEPYAAKVIAEACPDGHPALLAGQAIANKGVDRYGFPVSGKWWTVTFTCDHEISLK
jgi:hypothetical protein